MAYMKAVERYLKDSIENEKDLTWNGQMLNQAISLRSFEHLTYFCECLSVIDHFVTENKDSLYRSIKEVFKRQKPVRPKTRKTESPSSENLSKQEA